MSNEQDIFPVDQYIRDNVPSDFYVISLRFSGNGSDGSINNRTGLYLKRMGMISMTGKTGRTGTTWIGNSSININAISTHLASQANTHHHIFRSTYFTSGENGETNSNAMSSNIKIGNDNVQPEESYLNEDGSKYNVSKDSSSDDDSSDDGANQVTSKLKFLNINNSSKPNSNSKLKYKK